YPATSCSSRVLNEPRSRLDRRISTSRSVSLAPSIRVEAPTDSTVVIWRNVARRSGARVPSAFHSPLNSSISPTRRSRSGVSTRFLKGSIGISTTLPENTRKRNWVFPGSFAGSLGFAQRDRERNTRGTEGTQKSTKKDVMRSFLCLFEFCLVPFVY